MKTIALALFAALAVGSAFAQRPNAPPAPQPPPSFVPAVEPASAQQRLDQRRPARADGTVEINNMNGSIRVIGWDKNEVAVTGTLGEGEWRLELSGDSLRTVVQVVVPKNAHGVKEPDLEVHVPANSRVKVKTIFADIEVSKVTGALDLDSIRGKIRASDSPREVEVYSVHGNIDLFVSSPKVRVRTVSASLTLQEAQGDVEVSTVNGKIQVRGGLERGRFSTINGEIQFDGDLKPDGVFQFDTVNGNVDLLLPASVRADFQISATGIQNEFGPPPSGDRTFGLDGQSQEGYYPFGSLGGAHRGSPVRRLNFSTGGGGASVTASSFKGTVKLRKK